MSENEYPIFPMQLGKHFKQAFVPLFTIAQHCFDLFALHEPIHGEPVIELNTQHHIQQHAMHASAISLIHYYEQEKFREDACREHADSNLLSMCVFCGAYAHTGALELQQKNTWLQIEKHVQPNDMVLWLGAKVPLFANPKYLLQASYHRVRMPPGMERFTMSFSFDIDL